MTFGDGFTDEKNGDSTNESWDNGDLGIDKGDFEHESYPSHVPS